MDDDLDDSLDEMLRAKTPTPGYTADVEKNCEGSDSPFDEAAVDLAS